MVTSSMFLARTLFLVSIFTSLLSFINCRHLNLTSQDDIELHSLFQDYNKPGLKEIKTVHGDVYSCVNFHEQPAFNNPLLKDSLKTNPIQHNTSQSPIHKEIWANKEGCPKGTIPIRKYSKEQFFSTNRLFQRLYPSDDPLRGRFRSTVHTKNGPHTFYGTSASISVYNYQIHESQYSAGYLLVRAANDQLQFGWMINPTLYKDDKSRFFLTTTVAHKKCFNLLCGGFVHTNEILPVDFPIPGATIRGSGNMTEIHPKIIKEGNVWKMYAFHDVEIGYWPNEVLQGLKGPAEYLEWGGEAYNPDGLDGPKMGSGFFPSGNFTEDAYARNLLKYDESGKDSDVGAQETESYADDNNLYRVQDGGFVGGTLGHIMYFGGPGKTI